MCALAELKFKRSEADVGKDLERVDERMEIEMKSKAGMK